MDREIHERNRASLDRIRNIAARLSEDELQRPIDPPWTAAALFAHMSFWDQFAHARWRHAIDTRSGTPVSIGSVNWALNPPATSRSKR